MRPGQRVRVGAGRPLVMVLRSLPGAVLAIDRRGQVGLWSPWELEEPARAPRSTRAQLPHWAGELAVLGPLLAWWRGRCEPMRCGAECSAPGASCG
jgi:hypothetical protein